LVTKHPHNLHRESLEYLSGLFEAINVEQPDEFLQVPRDVIPSVSVVVALLVVIAVASGALFALYSALK